MQDDDDALLAQVLVDAVGVGGRSGLVEHRHGLEAGDPAGKERRVPGRVVAQLQRESEDGSLDPVAEVRLRRLLELGDHHGRELPDAQVPDGAVGGRHLDVGFDVLLLNLVR